MDSRQEIIQDLQEQAASIKELKNRLRQKRPIVIEFSGSPKSGKTSCINSLELFLKRNGFTVKTIQERASVCPVSDKLSPMFNIWTACTSLAGMIGTLESKDKSIDVLILDRGIFDALCWFDWLVKKGRMEDSQRDTMEHFLLLEDLVKSIDIVFAFTVDPNESIRREYTHLLTDKPGTIMNIETLKEYRDSVKNLCSSKSSYFHKIIEIDTTKKDQDLVGKTVTEKTLSQLSDLLMEKIGYLPRRNILSPKIINSSILKYSQVQDIFCNLQFDLRKKVEASNLWIQPIPIAIITNKKKDRVLIVKKKKEAVSPSSPEKDKLLAYVGGHIRFEDTTEITATNFLAICRKTLKREVKEELGISVALNDVDPYIIYTGEDDISKKHVAICFIVEQDESVKLHIDPEELVQNRGTSKSGSFMPLSEIEIQNNVESWSKLILAHCFGLQFSIQVQTSFEID